MEINDSDLGILGEMSNEELEVLCKIIIDKGGMTEGLSSNDRYKNFYPDHRKYVDVIADELIAFGSNTFFFNKTYKEIVVDVCGKMNIPCNKSFPIEQLEYRLLSDVLAHAWEGMSNEQRRAMLDSIGARDLEPSNASASSILKMFQSGGGLASRLAFSAASSVAQTMLGGAASSLSIGGMIAGSSSITPLLTVMMGPIGIAMAATLAAVGLGGLAYRVTIPATIYISGVRYIHLHPIDEEDEQPSFNPFGTLIEKVKHAVSAASTAVGESVHRTKDRAAAGVAAAKNTVINAASGIADKSADQVKAGAKNILKASSSLKKGLMRRLSRNADNNSAPPVSLVRKNWIAMPNKILIGLKWEEPAALDAAIFLLGADGRVTSDADFIFYNQPRHPSGSVIRNDGNVESFIIDFARVPVDIKTLVLTLTADENFNRIATCNIIDISARKGVLSRKFDMNDALSTVLGEFERRGDGWAFNALDQSSQMQLIDLCKEYGVNAE